MDDRLAISAVCDVCEHAPTWRFMALYGSSACFFSAGDGIVRDIAVAIHAARTGRFALVSALAIWLVDGMTCSLIAPGDTDDQPCRHEIQRLQVGSIRWSRWRKPGKWRLGACVPGPILF